MSAFLAHLLQRMMEPQLAVRPRVPSIYEAFGTIDFDEPSAETDMSPENARTNPPDGPDTTHGSSAPHDSIRDDPRGISPRFSPRGSDMDAQQTTGGVPEMPLSVASPRADHAPISVPEPGHRPPATPRTAAPAPRAARGWPDNGPNAAVASASFRERGPARTVPHGTSPPSVETETSVEPRHRRTPSPLRALVRSGLAVSGWAPSASAHTSAAGPRPVGPLDRLPADSGRVDDVTLEAAPPVAGTRAHVERFVPGDAHRAAAVSGAPEPRRDEGRAWLPVLAPLPQPGRRADHPMMAAGGRAVTPTVHVTIGRVEVRASVAAASSQRMPGAPPESTLRDYLRQRDGHGR